MRSLLLILLAGATASAACLPISEAARRVGHEVCVFGQVVQVKQSRSGTHFLNFCADYRDCPFTVVVFPRDLRQVGDVRQLAGKTIEIHGKVQLYDGRAEIVLRHSRQLRGEAARIPPVPKNYDVTRHGNYSAGRYSPPASPHAQKRRSNRRGADSVGEPEPQAAEQ